ncbi:MAG: OmpH family outer membrane protein [Gammaproteobacteria bacterium]|jgi:outer membrane protein
MKKWLSSIFMAAMLMVPLASQAADANLKIAVVNVSELMQKSPQAQAANDALKQKFSARESDLMKKRQALQKLNEQMKNEGDVMSAKKKENLQNEINDKSRTFSRELSAFQEDFNSARNEALGKLQKQIYNAIVQISEQGHYDIVLANNVVYASKRVDITNEVLDYLNKNKNKDSK